MNAVASPLEQVVVLLFFATAKDTQIATSANTKWTLYVQFTITIAHFSKYTSLSISILYTYMLFNKRTVLGIKED